MSGTSAAVPGPGTEVGRLNEAVDQLLTHWHDGDTGAAIARRDEIAEMDPHLYELLYHLAAVRGGLT